MIVLFAYILNCSPSQEQIYRQCASYISVHYYPISSCLSSIISTINTNKEIILMSVLHHEEILEDCLEQAVEEFCEANKLTEQMFKEISDHTGVMIAIVAKANKIFEGRCV